MADEVCGEQERGEESDEGKNAPACAEAFDAEEDAVKRR